MVKITCTSKPKALDGKVCGYVWDTEVTKLYVRCPSCREYIINPIHNKNIKEVKN